MDRPTITAIGGPTALVEYAGLRLLTDPTLSPAGDYPSATAVLVKTAGPAVRPPDLEPVDAVLLSHDHHSDNLDPAGRELLPRAGRVLTTTAGAKRLGGNAVGLEPWEATTVGDVEVTATPAEHGPPDVAPVTGPVIGFVLRAPRQPAVYASGDNASVDVVREVAGRLGPIDVAVLFAGAARVAGAFDGAALTLTAEAAVEAARALGEALIVPLHVEGWGHFSEGPADVTAAFARAGLGDRLRLLAPGDTFAA